MLDRNAKAYDIFGPPKEKVGDPWSDYLKYQLHFIILIYLVYSYCCADLHKLFKYLNILLFYRNLLKQSL